MELNGDKFECLRYGQDKQLQRDTQYTSNTGLPIQQKGRVKDLGVTMDSNVTFKAHIENAVTAANKQTGWVLRTFNTSGYLTLMPQPLSNLM